MERVEEPEDIGNILLWACHGLATLLHLTFMVTCIKLSPSSAQQGSQRDSTGPYFIMLNYWLLVDYGRKAITDFTCILREEEARLQYIFTPTARVKLCGSQVKTQSYECGKMTCKEGIWKGKNKGGRE